MPAPSTSELLEHRIVSQKQRDAWPVDRSRNGEKQWSEVAWGEGPLEGPNRLLFNWNIWPCRVVFEVTENCTVARGEALWRRSKLSIRMKGLKLLSADSGEEIKDVVLAHYDGERVIVDFRPTAGPGRYYLYYGATEEPLFDPSPKFKQQAAGKSKGTAKALRIEARTKLDDFDAMETIALKSETKALLRRFPDDPYLVFPEDRDRSIKLQFEIPADWAINGPKPSLVLKADRNEYRVFQLGVWACRKDVADLAVTASDLRGPDGAVLPASAVQCLTLESHIQSLYITKPSGHMPVPQGQIRALWFGIDIPENAAPGEYQGTLTVQPPNLPETTVPLKLVVSDTVVEEHGDHDLHRLSRLRWLESDVGLNDKVYPPYKPLKVLPGNRAIRSWGHTVTLGATGLPAAIDVGKEHVIAEPTTFTGKISGKRITWKNAKLTITAKKPGFVEWEARATERGITLHVTGRMEYDACSVIAVKLEAVGKAVQVSDLTLCLPWTKENAWLASGMGYRGRREGNRVWRSTKRDCKAFDPEIWMGSVEAGLGWKTWVADHWAGLTLTTPASALAQNQDAWEDISRPDAITIKEEGDVVALQLNLGSHRIGKQPWQLQFVLLPTPVKPRDQRHWDFRYMHKGGGFWPTDTDTPQSFLKDNCKRLNEAEKDLGVKRLNLHDWWGPAFNYPWQWDGPDNLKRLTDEAHKRDMFVKVYNSGRELSNLAPEFWAMVHEGAGYEFRDEVEEKPRLWFQDAWAPNHVPDELSIAGWPRLHHDLGNEHCTPVSNATRNGNFYLESMRYMTQFFGTDGAYWDGADGPTLGHREMAKRLWVMFKETNPDAVTDVHHGHGLVESPLTRTMLCFPFIDSLWHGEGFDYATFDPWAYLVEIAALPFGVPSEMLGGDPYVGRGMLFGIWPRHGWYRDTDKPRKLWAFFDRFGIKQAKMQGWWEEDNGVTMDRPLTYATAFCHPTNGVLLVVATWHEAIPEWREMKFDVTLSLDRRRLGLPLKGKLKASDIFSDEEIELEKPLPIPNMKFGRLIWIRKK